MKEKLNLRLILNFAPAIAGAAKALEYGFGIYGHDQLDDVRINRFPLSRTLNGAFRHLLLFVMGQRRDKDSGVEHIDHAISRLMFLSTALKLKLGQDDITKKFLPGEAEILEELFCGEEAKRSQHSVQRRGRKVSPRRKAGKRGSKR